MDCKLIADLVFIEGDKVLLVKYKDENKYDQQKGWLLPGDQLKEFEHPEDAALRIIQEQFNFKDAKVILDHIESFKGNDKSWHLVFHFKVMLPENSDLNISCDIETLKWFNFNELPDKKEVAHHGWALYTINTVIAAV
ncbi:MAG: NUDIX domain-containing protein [Ignavibacteria bacterium]